MVIGIVMALRTNIPRQPILVVLILVILMRLTTMNIRRVMIIMVIKRHGGWEPLAALGSR